MSSTWRRIYLHLVWGTKSRWPVLDAERERIAAPIFAHRIANLQSELLALGAADDHVHALVSIHPTMDVVRLVRSIKGATSQQIQRHACCEPPFRWQRGYAVLSVEPSDARELHEYILRQREHHVHQTTRAEWEPPLDLLDTEGLDEDVGM